MYGRPWVMILSLLIIFMGIAPFLGTAGYMPVALSFVPVSGTAYNITIIILGALVFISSRSNY